MATAASRRRDARDPTIYPVSDDVGEDLLQRLVAELLRPLLQRFLNARGRVARVGADQFIYWRQYNPRVAVSPDVYVLPGVAPRTRIQSWKVWETGIVPSFALEVVSRDVAKDYEDAPRDYADLGVDELVIYDPDHARAAGRVRWQVYRKLARRGFVRVQSTDADRVEVRALGCWLRVVGADTQARLRIALGRYGDDLFPTRVEAAEARRRAAEAKGRAAEAKGRAAEAERDAARDEVAKLRAEIARLKRV